MKKSITHIAFAGIDALFLTLMYYGVGWLRHFLEKLGLTAFTLYPKEDFVLVLALVILILWYERIYTYRFDFWEETKRILKALSLAMVIVLSFLMLSRLDREYSRSFIILYFISVMFFLPIFKRCMKKILFQYTFLRKKVKIIGNEEQGQILKEELESNWYLGMHHVDNGYEALFIATKGIPIEELNQSLNDYMQETKDIYLLPYIEKVNLTDANMIEYFNIRTSVIHIENKLLKPSNIIFKEIFEKIITLVILPFVALLHGLIAWRVRLDSDGPVLFKQKRLGKNCISFTCYKYRTMYENANQILEAYLEENPEEKAYYAQYHKYQNDPRITPFGNFLRRTSLDELPQVFNILRGEMNLVGPRPYMLEEVSKLGNDAKTIMWVKPGLTGLWQVSGRNSLTFHSRKELDIWYIENWSLWTDFIILLKTVKVVLDKKGAS